MTLKALPGLTLNLSKVLPINDKKSKKTKTPKDRKKPTAPSTFLRDHNICENRLSESIEYCLDVSKIFNDKREQPEYDAPEKDVAEQNTNEFISKILNSNNITTSQSAHDLLIFEINARTVLDYAQEVNDYKKDSTERPNMNKRVSFEKYPKS